MRKQCEKKDKWAMGVAKNDILCPKEQIVKKLISWPWRLQPEWNFCLLSFNESCINPKGLFTLSCKKHKDNSFFLVAIATLLLHVPPSKDSH